MLKGTSATISEAFSGRNNSFGLLRLVFAMAVLVAHSMILGFGHPLGGPVDIPGMAVAGFFGISGFLVTRSGRRVSVPRFLWHRALRILPGLAVCLLVTAFVFAPLIWLTTGGHFSVRDAGSYVLTNLPSATGDAGISGLLADTPYGRLASVDLFNGSLWTLSYEMACYLAVAVLALFAILRRARVVVLLVGLAWFGALCWNYAVHVTSRGMPVLYDGSFEIPGFGVFLFQWSMWYGFMFLAGGLFELYSDRIKLDDRLALAAMVILGFFLYQGVLFGPALLAYAYVILWLAVRLPAPLQRIGQQHDYSYGVYIYAFPVQQMLAKFGVPAWGFLAYTATCIAVTFALSIASWHLVERVAMKAKNYEFSWLRKYSLASRFGA